jgi:cellulose synthase/poly-beta-1,6-N-acetylglucosamine synthase-like glycosyltransferase
MNTEKYDNDALRRGYARWWLPLVILIVAGTVLATAAVMALPEEDLPLPDPHRPLHVRLMLAGLYLIIFVVILNLLRHYTFTLNRLFGRQRHPYLDIDTADWPRVTILIPAHNEERVIADILTAMLEVEYPRDRLTIVPLDDRSEDDTGRIIDEFATAHPDVFAPFHRKEGLAGKAAAMQDALVTIEDEIILVFDADYIPGRGLIKQLVAPFFDPEVGAVMGRVVPLNTGRNLLTRTLDLERAGGYQVDQQARMNLKLVPQYGGTVGGVRRRAVEAVGGWDVRSLAEDTDMTLRLLLAGWKTVYQNRSECYEQVPENWHSRMRQIFRWSRGHNQVLRKYAGKLLTNKHTRFAEKIDGMLLLHIYLMSLILIVGWSLGVVLWYLGVTKPGLIVILAVTSYSTLGNFAIFFEIAAATYLDGTKDRVKLLPFVMPGFLVSLMSVARATVTQPFARRTKDVQWHKTERSRRRTRWE